MSRPRLLAGLSLIGVAAALGALHADRNLRAAPAASSRTFEFTYQVHVPSNAEAGTSHLWIPLPAADGYQDIRELRIDSAAQHKTGRDSEYGDGFALFTPTVQQATAGYDAELRFTATRREHRVVLDGAVLQSVSNSHPRDPQLERYLQPDKLVPLDGVIAGLAREYTAGATTPLEKARKIYDYVVATMRYDKSGEGWGRGDAIWACTAKRGNCTDFHSLFIGMMRASGIPARFEIGFPLPEDKAQGDIAGYHCWAEFYIDGAGWIPVDASEAWKNPAKREYFFGAHDANRVFFSYGRDIRLSPEQRGEPLNYFIYPYAEASGRPVKDLKAHFAFREIPASRSAAARQP